MKLKIKLTRPKIFTLVLAFCVAVIAAAGGSVAYFTDTKATENVFTAGNVYIELSEAAVKADSGGNLLEDTEKDRIVGAEIGSTTPTVVDYGCLFPGQTIHKDPTIKNVGKNSAWVAAKVIITDGDGDIGRLYYSATDSDIDIRMLLRGGLLGESGRVGEWNGMTGVRYNENYAMVQASNRANGEYVFYFFMLNKLEKGESVELFDTMLVDPYFGNDEMEEFAQLKIDVEAYAVQSFGFSGCYEAMNEAFADQFAATRQTP
jgi:predicted ribosomally synthesized peptide with SipW-like signal peptide